jgi:hypothetical protein
MCLPDWPISVSTAILSLFFKMVQAKPEVI